MADAVTPLIHWRKGREVRHEYTREVVKQDVPEGAVKAMVRLATELEAANKRIERLETVIGALAREAAR